MVYLLDLGQALHLVIFGLEILGRHHARDITVVFQEPKAALRTWALVRNLVHSRLVYLRQIVGVSTLSDGVEGAETATDNLGPLLGKPP